MWNFPSAGLGPAGGCDGHHPLKAMLGLQGETEAEKAGLCSLCGEGAPGLANSEYYLTLDTARAGVGIMSVF